MKLPICRCESLCLQLGVLLQGQICEAWRLALESRRRMTRHT